LPAGGSGAEEALRSGAERLALAEDERERGEALDSLFLGSGSRRKSAEPSEAAPEKGDQVFLGKASQPGPVAAPAVPVARPSEGLPDKKALYGLFLQRTPSIVAFWGTTLAFPFIAIPVVGPAGYATLIALGQLASIAAGPAAGFLAGRLSPRKAMAINVVLRIVLALQLPAFVWLDSLNFWTLLVGSVATSWTNSSIMTTENSYVPHLAGEGKVRTVNSLLQINYFSIMVLLGLAGLGATLDRHSLLLPYYISAAIHALIVLPVAWFMLPKASPQRPKGPPLGQGARTVLAFLKGHAGELILLGAAVFSFLLLRSAIPIAAALMWLISRTKAFKALWASKPLRNAALLLALGAFLLQPFQYFALQEMAKALVGESAKALLYGKLMGLFFLGQMLSSSSLLEPHIGRIPLQRLLQAVILAVTGVWVWGSLFPGSFLAAGLAMGLGALLMALASRLTDRGWLRWTWAGFSFILLPLVFWGNLPVLFASVLMIGFSYAPNLVTLTSYFQNNAGEKIGESMGAQGALFNAAISLGFALLGANAGLFHPIFPGLLVPMSAAFGLSGLVFLFAPRFLPGLSRTSFQARRI